MTGPSEGQERSQPPASAWRYGDIWDFAERLASALTLNGDAEVWVWPEDAKGPDTPPDYAVFDLAERTEADALRRLDRGDPGVTVTGEPPEVDLWRVDPAAPDPDCDYDLYAWWRWQLSGGNPDERPPRRHGAGGNSP